MVHRLKTRLSSLFRRSRYERELASELEFHIDMLTEQYVRAGMAAAEARRAALRNFGPLERVKDDVRDTWLSRLWETLVQDARYGFRNLRRSPGFAFVVVFTMALGIGANTAIFSVVNGVLLRPLPFKDGEQLVVLRQQQPAAGVEDMGFSYKEILDYREAKSLDGLVEFHNMWFILLGRSEPERVSTGVVSANFFDVLGVKPLYGRTLQAADDAPGAPAVLLLSHGYWKKTFGGDPTVVGKVYQMNDRPHQVVGILPPVPQYPLEVDVYMPTSACPFRSSKSALENRTFRIVGTAFGRLKPGVTLDKCHADLSVVSSQLQLDHPREYPKERGYRATASPLQDEMTREFRRTLLVLLGTAGFVLLIVCASVANLMLARMVRREREVAVRAALGASHTRLLRQLLTESTILAIAGGAIGLGLAHWGVDLLVAYAQQFTPRATEIQIDTSVLLYTFGISVVTGLVFGSVPAINGSLSVSPALRDSGRATHNRQTIRNWLIVVQVAASFMLLIGAGLTIRSLIKLQQVDPGFRTDNILTMRIDLNFTKYRDERTSEFWQRVEERMKGIPGVITAGGGGTFPLNDGGSPSGSILIKGRKLPQSAGGSRVDFLFATPDYFAAIGQPLISGRNFNLGDNYGTRQTRPVALINRSMARRYWGNEDPLGQQISGNGGNSWATIVGVVADTRQQLREPVRDEVYLPIFQRGFLSTNWLVRSRVDPAIMQREIRSAVHAIDPDQPVDNFRTLAEVRSASLASPTLVATLLGLFGLLALVITAAGIAGVIAFSVNQRTHEFGIRMALGAQRASVLSLVLRQGLALVLSGLAIGLAGALVLTRLLTTLLFGIQPTDGFTFVAVSMVLIAVAAIACLIPAQRAASVDPMVALRVG
ncbi:MAG: ABC transporter permease [Vicinamibacterales bacterium]